MSGRLAHRADGERLRPEIRRIAAKYRLGWQLSAELLKTAHFLRIGLPVLTAGASRAQSRRAGRKSRIGLLHQQS